MNNTAHEILQVRILEWVAIPFSEGSPQLSDQTQVSHIAGGFFTSWATREALAFIICRLFGNGHSDGCEVTLHCSFDLHFYDN